MAIIIHGDNRGIAVDGDLKIGKLEFSFGEGVKSASNINRKNSEDSRFETDLIPVENVKAVKYPEISEAQRIFFENKIWISLHKNGKDERLHIDLPKEWVLHTIYDFTTEWNPTFKTSAHQWRILYEVLLRLKYFKIVARQRFKAYVDAVVEYCFPNVSSTYANNISKTSLAPHIEDWSETDKRMYRSLKKLLSYPESAEQLP